LGYFADYLNEVRRMAGFAPVLVVGPLPKWDPSLPEDVWYETHRTMNLSDIPRRSFNGMDRGLFSADQTYKARLSFADVHFVSAIDALCSDEGCIRYYSRGDKLELASPDYGHLSLAASTYFAENSVGPQIL